MDGNGRTTLRRGWIGFEENLETSIKECHKSFNTSALSVCRLVLLFLKRLKRERRRKEVFRIHLHMLLVRPSSVKIIIVSIQN